jgi:MFS family permease
VALGVVSLFMDASSELVHSLLPLLLASALGASMVTIGAIEGVAEATAAISKVFSGALSDYVGRRKRLVVLGYGLAALTKPVFPLASSIGWVFAARFADRIGKGIRGAPRDALVADLTPADLRGAAYGLRQSLDSVGAVIGPLTAALAMVWWAGDLRAVLWLAVVPAVLSVLVLVVGVHDPSTTDQRGTTRPPLSLGELKGLSSAYWWVVALGGVFTLARFSEAFLLLRALDVGLGAGAVPLVLVVMNVVYAAGAYPAGVLSDRIGTRGLLLAGLAVLAVADVSLALAASPLLALAGAAGWGLHLALTQGLLSKLVAGTAPTGLRGTAFGVFNLATGVALLAASVLAGWLWSAFGAEATFFAGAAFAAAALAGLAIREA